MAEGTRGATKGAAGMSGKDDAATRWAVQVIVEFDHSLFRRFRVAQWNEFASELVRRGLVPIAWAKGEAPPPVAVAFDFSGLRVRRCRLTGIDFTFADLSASDFEGSSLKNAKLGDCPRANLRNALLDGTQFRGDVSGADLTGSTIDGADFSHSYCHELPIGLPPEALAAIKVVPREPGEGCPEEPFMQPLRARVTIHEVPW